MLWWSICGPMAVHVKDSIAYAAASEQEGTKVRDREYKNVPRFDERTVLS